MKDYINKEDQTKIIFCILKIKILQNWRPRRN